MSDPVQRARRSRPDGVGARQCDRRADSIVVAVADPSADARAAAALLTSERLLAEPAAFD
jgi:hypothetical protein